MKGKTLLITLAISPLLYMWQGFTLKTLWEWFLVPIGLPTISVAIAAGIVLIHNFFTAKHSKDNDKNIMDKMIFAFVAPAAVLVFGFIIQWFV